MSHIPRLDQNLPLTVILATAAQFFTGREERWRVLNHFLLLQEKQAWPSRACGEMLNHAWGR